MTKHLDMILLLITVLISSSFGEEKCRNLEFQDNGYFEPEFLTGYPVGTIVTYKCNPGFEINGRMQNICLSRRTWAYSSPTCEPIKCPQPNDVINAHLISYSRGTYEYGDSVQFECHGGYRTEETLQTTWTSVCLDNKTWSNNYKECVVINCKIPKVPFVQFTHAYNDGWDGELLPEYESVFAQCLSGSKWSDGAAGEKKRIRCAEGGVLNRPIPTCTSIPHCDVPSFENGFIYKHNSNAPIEDSYILAGTIVRVRCAVNAVIFSNEISTGLDTKYIQCSSQGFWVDNFPSCRLICDLKHFYTIPHLDFSGDILQTGESAKLKCEDGYDLLIDNTTMPLNSTTVYCDNDGHLNRPHLKCESKPCKINTDINRNVTHIDNPTMGLYDLPFNSRVSLRCLDSSLVWSDKTVDTNRQFNCAEGGKWIYRDTIFDQLPKCLMPCYCKGCQLSDPVLPGSSWNVICQDNMSKMRNVTTCTMKSQWENGDPCRTSCNLDHPVITWINKTNILPDKTLPDQLTATYKCNGINDIRTTTCRGRTLSPQPDCPCLSPDPDAVEYMHYFNHNGKVINSRKIILSGDHIILHCKDATLKLLRCLNGTFKGEMKCESITVFGRDIEYEDVNNTYASEPVAMIAQEEEEEHSIVTNDTFELVFDSKAVNMNVSSFNDNNNNNEIIESKEDNRISTNTSDTRRRSSTLLSILSSTSSIPPISTSPKLQDQSMQLISTKSPQFPSVTSTSKMSLMTVLSSTTENSIGRKSSSTESPIYSSKNPLLSNSSTASPFRAFRSTNKDYYIVYPTSSYASGNIVKTSTPSPAFSVRTEALSDKTAAKTTTVATTSNPSTSEISTSAPKRSPFSYTFPSHRRLSTASLLIVPRQATTTETATRKTRMWSQGFWRGRPYSMGSRWNGN